jgi:uncharacterized protein (TIGR00725 family)
MKTPRVVSVFGSSRPREGDPEYVLAYETGKELANAGFTVCNGGYAGIMEASARGAKEAGGATLGIVTDIFPKKVNAWIDNAVTKRTLVERMMELISRGEAYVVLKGGTGTLLELSAVWEFMNKGIMHERPIVVVGSFWNAVVDTLREELAWEGLDDCTRYVTLVDTPLACAQFIRKKLDGGPDGAHQHRDQASA